MKKVYIIVFSLLLLLLFVSFFFLRKVNNNLNASITTPTTNANMIIHVIDYGDGMHGDAVLVESNGSYLLMDTGGEEDNNTLPCYSTGCITNDGLPIIKYLKKIGVKNLSIYLSHYDGDHLLNIKDIINYKEGGKPYFTIDNVYLPAVDKLETEYNKIIYEENGTTPICKNASSMDNASLLCAKKMKIGKIIGKEVSSTNDYTFIASGGCTYNNHHYISCPSAYVHRILFDDSQRPSNVKKPVYITTPKKITIGNATLKVLYHNQLTDPLDFDKYKKSRYEDRYGDVNGKKARMAAFANNISLVSVITSENQKFFTAGDIQVETELELMNSGINFKADLMKLSHHGEQTSNFPDFVNNYVKPSLIFYQSGHESSYKNVYTIKQDANGKEYKELTDIEYKNLRTTCSNSSGNFVTINNILWRNTCDNSMNLDGNKNFNKITTSNQTTSSGEVGTFRYVFTGSTIKRECVTSDCVRKSVKVTFKLNDGTKNENGEEYSASQTFVTDWTEPYKFGYTYLGTHKWVTNPNPFGFDGWKWTSNSKSNTCSSDCAIAGWSTNSNGSTIDYNTYSGVVNNWINSNAGEVTLHAVWRPKYTYTLDNQGATTAGTKVIYGVKDKGIYLNSIETKMSSSSNCIEVPTKTNYAFKGYYVGDKQLINTNGCITSNFNIDSYLSNKTLIAKWTADSYTINYNLNGGTHGSNHPTSVPHDQLVTISNPTKKVVTKFDINNQGATANTSSITKSYTFNGWDITGMDSSKHTYGSNTSTSTSLFGIKATSYKSLRSSKGTVNFTAKWNSISVKLPTITKSNYTCEWRTENNGTQSVTSGGSWTYTGATERVFKAHCETNKFGVTLNNQSATTKGTTKLYGKYETGIYLDSGYSKKMTSSSNSITKPEKKYVVTFNANGGKISKTNAVSNYTFGGYYIDTSGNGTKIINANGYLISNTLITSSKEKTLYAKWTSVSVTLPTPTKDGYTFAGWYTAASGGTKVGNGGASYTPKSKITLYAHWTANSYTIKFDANGGSGTMKNQTIKYGVSTALTGNTFKKNGYTFAGWSTTKGGTKKYNNRQSVTSLAKSGTVTLYAVWKINSGLKIKDTSYMKLNSKNIVVKLKSKKKKINRSDMLSNLTITGTYKVINKNSKEITSSSSLITTSSKITVGSTNYNIIIIGDVNKDGEIDTSDLVGVFKKMSKKSNLDSLQLIAADYNQDGEIDTSDLVGILKKMME